LGELFRYEVFWTLKDEGKINDTVNENMNEAIKTSNKFIANIKQ